ncbi:MAG: hypothetical protein H7241_03570 [Novosphingobium sp.]|nr:hypothetical protein [Novosphingobium sp.]
MKKMSFPMAALVLASAGLVISSPAEARRHYRGQARGHGHCLRFDKTTGAVAGGVGGALLGGALIGGTGGTLAGAAAGALGGHALAKDGRKNCR